MSGIVAKMVGEARQHQLANPLPPDLSLFGGKITAPQSAAPETGSTLSAPSRTKSDVKRNRSTVLSNKNNILDKKKKQTVLGTV